MDLDRFALSGLPWAESFAPGQIGWLKCFSEGRTVAQGLNRLLGGGVARFEESTETLAALEYERRVAEGSVPTRDNLHDFFNGLMWLRWPLSKRSLNEAHLLEASEAARSENASGNGRSRRRDALTLLDEAGAVLVASDPIYFEWLAEHDWKSLLVQSREQWLAGELRLHLFGHGLLESLANKPHKGLCAKVLCVAERELPHGLDAWLNERIQSLGSPRELRPLPVFGVPGWSEANQNPDFYRDASVFRAKPTL